MMNKHERRTWRVADKVMYEAAEVDADVVQQRRIFVRFHLRDEADSINELHEHRAERVGHGTHHLHRTTQTDR